MYFVVFTRSAIKELESLPSHEIGKIIRKIEALSINPRPSGVKKIAGKLDLWRIRSGNYRIIYSIRDEKLVVEIIRIRHRKEVYKK